MTRRRPSGSPRLRTDGGVIAREVSDTVPPSPAHPTNGGWTTSRKQQDAGLHARVTSDAFALHRPVDVHHREVGELRDERQVVPVEARRVLPVLGALRLVEPE